MERKINEIIVHCSATPEGINYTVDDIRRWHVEGNGWADCGYHYVIHLDGSVHEGRPLAQVGAHCRHHNLHSIGVCYIGGVGLDGKTPKDTRTTAQKHSLIKLLQELKQRFPGARIYGHRDFAAKACPSFDAHTEYKFI